MATPSNNGSSEQQPPVRILGATQISNPPPIVLGASQARADDVTPVRPKLQGRPKVLARRPDNPDAHIGGQGADRGQNSQNGQSKREAQPEKTLEQRQEEYAAARARIFGDGAGSGLGDDEDPSAAQVTQGMSNLKVSKAQMRRPDTNAGYSQYYDGSLGAFMDPDYERQPQWGPGGFPGGLGFSPGAFGGFNQMVQGFPNAGSKGVPPKGKGKGPSGPFLPRQRVFPEQMTGQVIEWKGKFGWIHASTQINHPKARKHQNKIFISTIDIVGATSLCPGDYCSFYVFEDEAGIGAEECVKITPQD